MHKRRTRTARVRAERCYTLNPANHPSNNSSYDMTNLCWTYDRHVQSHFTIQPIIQHFGFVQLCAGINNYLNFIAIVFRTHILIVLFTYPTTHAASQKTRKLRKIIDLSNISIRQTNRRSHLHLSHDNRWDNLLPGVSTVKRQPNEDEILSSGLRQ